MKGSAFSSSRKIWISCMKALMYLCSGLTGALVLFLMGYVLIKGIPNISWELLSTSPSYLSDRIGILPDLMNTLYIVLATRRGRGNLPHRIRQKQEARRRHGICR